MIDIWVNGVKWNHSNHGQTGCMSQYNVIPDANNSPLNIGTMAMDAWFPGAIGKVAIYNKLLTAAQVTAHYRAMTGAAPTGTLRQHVQLLSATPESRTGAASAGSRRPASR